MRVRLRALERVRLAAVTIPETFTSDETSAEESARMDQGCSAELVRMTWTGPAEGFVVYWEEGSSSESFSSLEGVTRSLEATEEAAS
jgi:hypothetical protein